MSRQKSLTTLLIFFYISSFTQPILTDTSIIIKPKFRIGETMTYLVTEKYKIDNNLIIPIKAEHNFKVSFTVLDTSDGYTISYFVQTIKTNNKKYLIESIKAQISNGLNLIYKLNNDGWMIDFPNYTEAQLKIINALDSIISREEFKKDDLISLSILRKRLEKPAGLEICLTPFLLFNDIFTKPIF